MPTFLFSGTDSNGSSVTDRLDAASLSAARYKLELQGFRDLVFHTDEMAARINETICAEFADKLPDCEIDPEEELRARQGGGAWRELWQAWKADALVWVPLFTWSATAIYHGRPFGWLDLTAFTLSGIFVAYFVWLVLPAVAYQRLLEHGVWHRWDSLRWWSGLIRLLKRIAVAPIPEFELHFREGYALAAECRLEQALNLVRQYENHPVGKFQYYSRLSGLYQAAGQYKTMTECLRLAAEHGTGKPEEKLDIAVGLLRRERKTDEAKEILDAIDLADCGDLVAIFYSYALGLLRVETEDWVAAEEQLRKTIQQAEPYANNVLMDGMLHDIYAYLSLALAGQGKLQDAKAFFKKAAPLLRARKETELLNRCHTALGRA